MPDNSSRPSIGTGLLPASAGAGSAISLANYVLPGNGIHGSAGALLVVISTLLMLLAAAALVFARGAPPSLRGILLVLITLDILGTGLAAYMLEANWLIAAMAVALIGLIVHLAARSAQDRRPASPATSGAVS
jgi:hypothetical protein